MAIEGETYEFEEMYPRFEIQARLDGASHWMAEIKDQIEESRGHAEQFQAMLVKAEKRFAALKGVEQRHADAYTKVLEKL